MAAAKRGKTVSFTRSDGTKVTLKAKKAKAPPKTKAALERRLKKVPAALRPYARAKWMEAHGKK